MTTLEPPPDTIPAKTPRRAALASFMGSAVEYYDFFLFGSAAALIFPHIFFPKDDTAALVMSFMTFGFAYVARPVGAVILGHFGDRIGRQRVLMFTLVLMGLSTFLIGCLPTFSTIGWAAPVLLVLCRLMQGFSAAGEQAGLRQDERSVAHRHHEVDARRRAAQPVEHLRQRGFSALSQGLDVHGRLFIAICAERRRLFLHCPPGWLMPRMARSLSGGAFSLSSPVRDERTGSRFVDAGKTVKTGHSGAAVSGHNLTTRRAVMSGGQSQSGGDSG